MKTVAITVGADLAYFEAELKTLTLESIQSTMNLLQAAEDAKDHADAMNELLKQFSKIIQEATAGAAGQKQHA